ncbi:hypothetical protein PHMEG_00035919 [Phytophthora megakarya]|uniref:CCHC-type domain-containing protein n=1 Tax=Phytophthora megakarya TaxID=4795 RepID=A0A225UMP0_9STRA|nr:hypothetical protein PHMEG_00035919 [Phytophthora megakarya]
MDEATKVVTFMKGLRDGPVKTYLFREYPNTLEKAITLAMQEEFSLKQAKLHTNVPRPPRPAPKTEGPEPMDLSYASAGGQQKKKANNVRCFRCGNMGHYARECTAPVHSSQGQRGDTGYRHGQTKNGKDQLPLMDFDEKHMPRSQLEVRLATGAIVKTEKRAIRARFSYKHRVFVEILLVLDLDDKFDMVLGMPWLARHDPEIDWEKQSDGPVSAADTPNGASEPPSETVARAAVSGRSAWSARAVTTPGVVNTKGVSGQGPDTTKKLSAVRRRRANSVSTPGVDTCSILDSRTFSDEKNRSDNSVSALGDATHCSAVRRRGDDKASTPGVDATSCADGCKRPALKLACCRAAGLHEAGRDQAGLDDAARGYKNPSAVSRNIRPLPGLDETQVNPGFTRRSNGASTRRYASLGPGPRLFKTQEPDSGHRDVERLDAGLCWVSVPEDGVGEPSD